jgi:hypothetical protein
MGALHELPSTEQLADITGDATLAALLAHKPDDEAVPVGVWWLVAETLRTSVTIRRMLTSGPAPDREDLPMLVSEATLLSQTALDELAVSAGVTPTPVEAPEWPSFGLRATLLLLARMMVSCRTTSPQRLANTLSAHLRALAAIEADPQRTSRGGLDLKVRGHLAQPIGVDCASAQ